MRSASGSDRSKPVIQQSAGIPAQVLSFEDQERMVGLRSVMLAFGVFEADSGYEEIAERISKFKKYHEITAIEDNFPFKLCDQQLFTKLINEAEVVFDPYSL